MSIILNKGWKGWCVLWSQNVLCNLILRPSVMMHKNYQVRWNGKSGGTKEPKPDTKFDLIGPFDPETNLRRIIFARPTNESPRERRLRLLREAVFEWNQAFWREQNKQFFDEKKKFMESIHVVSGKDKEMSDDLSVFYKEFLDRNYKKHTAYNWAWYRMNFSMLWLSFLVMLERLFKRHWRRQDPKS